MKKYITTAPVSGSKKVKIEGIKKIIITLKSNFLCSLFVFKEELEIILVKYNIKDNFINSLGWKEKKPKLNQALEPLTFVPKNKTKKSKKTLKK